MFPVNRKPIPVFVEYTVRGKRVKKLFNSQVESKRFYIAKLNAGADPKVIRATDRLPSLPQ